MLAAPVTVYDDSSDVEKYDKTSIGIVAGFAVLVTLLIVYEGYKRHTGPDIALEEDEEHQKWLIDNPSLQTVGGLVNQITETTMQMEGRQERITGMCTEIQQHTKELEQVYRLSK